MLCTSQPVAFVWHLWADSTQYLFAYIGCESVKKRKWGTVHLSLLRLPWWQNAVDQVAWTAEIHFLTVLETGQPQDHSCRRGWFLASILFPVCRLLPASVSSQGLSLMDVVEKEQSLSPFSSKAASPIGLGTHPYDLIYLLKTLSSIITLTVRLRHGNQGGRGRGGEQTFSP